MKISILGRTWLQGMVVIAFFAPPVGYGQNNGGQEAQTERSEDRPEEQAQAPQTDQLPEVNTLGARSTEEQPLIRGAISENGALSFGDIQESGQKDQMASAEKAVQCPEEGGGVNVFSSVMPSPEEKKFAMRLLEVTSEVTLLLSNEPRKDVLMNFVEDVKEKVEAVRWWKKWGLGFWSAVSAPVRYPLYWLTCCCRKKDPRLIDRVFLEISESVSAFQSLCNAFPARTSKFITKMGVQLPELDQVIQETFLGAEQKTVVLSEDTDPTEETEEQHVFRNGIFASLKMMKTFIGLGMEPSAVARSCSQVRDLGGRLFWWRFWNRVSLGPLDPNSGTRVLLSIYDSVMKEIDLLEKVCERTPEGMRSFCGSVNWWMDRATERAIKEIFEEEREALNSMSAMKESTGSSVKKKSCLKEPCVSFEKSYESPADKNANRKVRFEDMMSAEYEREYYP